MNVSSVSSLSSLDAVQAAQPQASSSPATVPGDTSSISSGGDLMKRLQELEQTDPAKFKQVMTQIAGQLRTQAQDATGTQAQSLSKLADAFDKAGQTGNLAALKPPDAAGGSGGAHHHHHAHVQKYAAQATSGNEAPTASVGGVVQSALQSAGA